MPAPHATRGSLCSDGFAHLPDRVSASDAVHRQLRQQDDAAIRAHEELDPIAGLQSEMLPTAFGMVA
jgi:hypothetical protein